MIEIILKQIRKIFDWDDFGFVFLNKFFEVIVFSARLRRLKKVKKPLTKVRRNSNMDNGCHK